MSVQRKIPPPSSSQKKKVTAVVTKTLITSPLPIETIAMIGSQARIASEIVLKDDEIRDDAVTEEILRQEEARQAKLNQKYEIFDDFMRNSPMEVNSREYNYHKYIYTQTKNTMGI